jgi:hypothetical protein
LGRTGAFRSTRDRFSIIYGIASNVVTGKLLPGSIVPRFRERLRKSRHQVTGFPGCKAGQVLMDRAPGRIGFMSTQRRACRPQRTFRTKCARMMEQTGSSFERRFGRTIVSGVTAPLMSIIRLAWAWLLGSDAGMSPGAQDRVATNSLPSDHRSKTLARLRSRCGSPPMRAAGRIEEPSGSATPWSSTLHSPKLPARTRLHLPLPHAPAGQNRWAERHDGKGNLHIQHAA